MGGKTQVPKISPNQGARRDLSGPARAFQLDHTPAVTVPERKFTLMGTDRSSFFKGGEKKPPARAVSVSTIKTGNRSCTS